MAANVSDPGLAAHLAEYPYPTEGELPSLPSGFTLDEPAMNPTDLPVGFTLDEPVAQSKPLSNKAQLQQNLASYKRVLEILPQLLYNFTLGPFEEAAKVLSGPTLEEHRQAIANMTGEDRAAYISQLDRAKELGTAGFTPLQALMSPVTTDEEKIAAMGPLTGLGLLGALAATPGGVGKVPSGFGKGFLDPALYSSPPPPRPRLALPPGHPIVAGPAPVNRGLMLPEATSRLGMTPLDIAEAQQRIMESPPIPLDDASRITVTQGEPFSTGTVYTPPETPSPHPTLDAARQFRQASEEIRSLSREIDRLQAAGLPVPSALPNRLSELRSSIQAVSSEPVITRIPDRIPETPVPAQQEVQVPSVAPEPTPPPAIRDVRTVSADIEGRKAAGQVVPQALRLELKAARAAATATPPVSVQSQMKLHESTGLPLNNDGTVTLYHGTTKDAAMQIQKSGRLTSAGEPEVYLTTDPSGGDYGDGTVVQVRVRPELLSLNDEFPGGRKDFSAPVSKTKTFPVKVENIATTTQPPPAPGLHAGLPIPENVKQWIARNATKLTGGTSRSATADLTGRAATEYQPSNPTVAALTAKIDKILATGQTVPQALRDQLKLAREQSRVAAPPPPTPAASVKNAPSGAPPPSSAKGVVTPEQLPRNYSDKLANKNRTRPLFSGGFHGMHQVADAAPDAAVAFRASSNASGAWAYRVLEARDLIGAQVGPTAWERLKAIMSQSQQNGNVRRWADLAREIGSANPQDVPALYRARAGDAMATIGEEPFRVAEQLANRFDAATTDAGRATNASKLQAYLTRSFKDASANVTQILDHADYHAGLRSPEFKRSLEIWNTAVGKDLRAAHVAHDGHLLRPEYLGETGEYFPMTGEAAAEQAAAGLKGQRPSGPYSEPGNPLNFRRGGLSPKYDLTDAALQRRVSAAGWANDTAAAIARAEQDGLIRKIPPGTPAKAIPRTYDFRGVTYKAERVGDHVMPSWVRDEIGPIFEHFRPPGPAVGLVGKITKGIVKTNTMLGVDKFFHYVNETGLLGAQAPTLGQSTVGRTVGSLPGVKTVHAFTTLFHALAPTERPLVHAMLRNGEWFPRFTDTGALTGMSRRDLAGRLAMRQSILRWNPKATPQMLYEASTRFGEYNPQLASNLIRAIKSSPVFSTAAPFVTAGNAFVRNAVGTLTLQGPAGASGRLVAGATGGIPAALGTWIAVHKGITGKVPDPSDRDFKLFQIPIRTTPMGRTVYLNVGRLIAPLGARGARSIGLTGALETLARGGTSKQALEQALGDLTNAWMHPLTGPAVKVGTRFFGGVDPQLQFRGGSVGLRPAHEPTDTVREQIVANVRSAGEAINPGIERLVKPVERVFGVVGGRNPAEGLSPVEQAAQAIGILSVSNNRRQASALHHEAQRAAATARRIARQHE